MNNSSILQKNPIKLGLTEMLIKMGLTKVASIMCSLPHGGWNQSQSNGIP